MNTDKHTKEYLEKLRSLKLSDASRNRIEEQLIGYARFNEIHEPVRVERVGRSIWRAPQWAQITQFVNTHTRMTAALLIALMISGGTSYAAASSLPGDILYPIKTEINENIKSAFALSAEAEARLQARLAEERLREAAELKARGTLTSDTALMIQENLRAHYDRGDDESSELESNGSTEAALEVRTALAGTLRAYASLIEEAQSEGEASAILENLRIDVELEADNAERARVESGIRFLSDDDASDDDRIEARDNGTYSDDTDDVITDIENDRNDEASEDDDLEVEIEAGLDIEVDDDLEVEAESGTRLNIGL